MGSNEELEDQSRLGKPREPSLDVLAEQPSRIGLVVHLVADPHELVPARQRRHLRKSDVNVGSRQIDPPDNARDDLVRSGNGEERSVVSATLGRACTAIVLSIPHTARRGLRSSAPNGRRIAATSSVIQSYDARAGSQKCW